jgi:hypothetical protein
MTNLPPPERYHRQNGEQPAWGIIRYAPGSGLRCGDDAAGFDGWYHGPLFSLANVAAVAEEWVREHPGWVVAVVSLEQGWFGQGDFSRVSRYPLTLRERVFGTGAPADEKEMSQRQCELRRAAKRGSLPPVCNCGPGK